MDLVRNGRSRPGVQSHATQNRRLALALASFATVPLLAQESAQTNKTLVDNWAIMKMADAKVGYIHTLVTETGTGDARRISTATVTRHLLGHLVLRRHFTCY